jgi:para-nitrobenzyl esterase
VEAIAGDAPPRALADALHGAAAAFVRDGDAGWRPWSAAPGSTRLFGAAASVPDMLADGYAEVRALL